MTKRKKIVTWVVVGILGTGLIIALTHRRQPVTLRGSVLRQDVDPNKQLPLADVQITAINGLGSGKTSSDSFHGTSRLLKTNSSPLRLEDTKKHKARTFISTSLVKAWCLCVLVAHPVLQQLAEGLRDLPTAEAPRLRSESSEDSLSAAGIMRTTPIARGPT